MSAFVACIVEHVRARVVVRCLVEEACLALGISRVAVGVFTCTSAISIGVVASIVTRVGARIIVRATDVERRHVQDGADEDADRTILIAWVVARPPGTCNTPVVQLASARVDHER